MRFYEAYLIQMDPTIYSQSFSSIIMIKSFKYIINLHWSIVIKLIFLKIIYDLYRGVILYYIWVYKHFYISVIYDRKLIFLDSY